MARPIRHRSSTRCSRSGRAGPPRTRAPEPRRRVPGLAREHRVRPRRGAPAAQRPEHQRPGDLPRWQPAAPWLTSGAIPAGSSGVFSASSLAGATQATILLPLAQGATRSRMTIAASNGTSGGRASVVVDTVSGGMAARTEPSDVYFCTRPDTFFLLAEDRLWLPPPGPGRRARRRGRRLVARANSPSFASDGTLAQPYPVAVTETATTTARTSTTTSCSIPPSFRRRTTSKVSTRCSPARICRVSRAGTPPRLIRVRISSPTASGERPVRRRR